MKRTLKLAWTVLAIVAVVSLFAPGDAALVFGSILIFASFPLGFVVQLAFFGFLNVLRFCGWSGTGDGPWLVLNVADLFLVGLVGFFQWFILLPRIGTRLRRRQS